MGSFMTFAIVSSTATTKKTAPFQGQSWRVNKSPFNSSNTIYTRIFCDHLNVLYFFDPTCIILKSGRISTARMPRLIVSSFVLPNNTPQRRRLADGDLSSPYLPSSSFTSFDAASVMLCCSPPAPSSTRLCTTRVSVRS